MKTEEKVILPTDECAAKFITNVSGWVDIDGRFWGTDERSARYSSSTHFKCECGNIEKRGWTKCDACREVNDVERYNKLKFEAWNGSDYVYSGLADKYFNNTDDIEEYCEDNDINPKDLRLVLCAENDFREIDGDLWEDVMSEDSEGELPNKLQEALDAFNAIIRTLPPASYSPSNTRTSYE